MRSLSLALLALALAAAPVAGATAGPGPWRSWWGATSVRQGVFRLESTPPSSPSETHSALLTSAPLRGDATFSFTATTLAQLRLGSAPNPWEAAWAMFRFRDLENYYWFVLKPNGWELGKKQGSDTQRFLATGPSPTLALGRPNAVRIVTEGSRIRITVDGAAVVDFTDPRPLPAGGSVGLYEEDARVRFDAVSVTST